jgi:hypothetical protein
MGRRNKPSCSTGPVISTGLSTARPSIVRSPPGRRTVPFALYQPKGRRRDQSRTPRTIMLPSLNAHGASLSHVTNFPASYIPTASVPMAVSAAGTVQLVAAVSGKAIYVIDWDMLADGRGRSRLNMALARIPRQGRRPSPAHAPQRLSSAGLHSRRQRTPPRDCSSAAASLGFVAYAQR